jgi:hypothetical protein
VTVAYVQHAPETEGAIEQSPLYKKGYVEGYDDAQWWRWGNLLARLLPTERTMPYWQGYAAGQEEYEFQNANPTDRENKT